MKVLVGCEFSGVVRQSFRDRGHDAWSCDLLPAEDESPFHIRGDVMDVLDQEWNLGIFHPPCTDLAVSGARHFAKKALDNPRFQEEAAEFFMTLYNAYIPRVAVENPVGMMSTMFRPPDQYVQPWMFGHPETKKTGLWLRNLPLLVETNNVYEEMMSLSVGQRNRVHHESPGPDRWKARSRTLQGIADAMAEQWS